MCAGNFLNQEIAFKGQVIDSINLILKNILGDSLFQDRELVKLKISLQASCIELLLVMLEETNKKSSDLAKGISEDLDIEILLETMLKLNSVYYAADDALKYTKYRGVCGGFHALMKIADYLNISVDKLVKPKVKFSDEMDMLWQHVKDHTRSIEIKYISNETDPGILTRVYFPFDPAKQLKEEIKALVKNKSDRKNPESKVKSLLDWMEAIRRHNEHEHNITGKWWLRLSLMFPRLRHYLLFVLTILLNLLVLFGYTIPQEIKDTRFNDTSTSIILVPGRPFWLYILIIILGCVHVILSLWMLCEYFVREKPNIIWSIPDTISNLVTYQSVWKNYILPRYKHLRNSKFFKKLQHHQHPICFEKSFLSFPPIYRILFVLCSIAALGTNGYFYCVCLLYILFGIDVLDTVLTALGRSFWQLIAIILLGLVVLLIYAVIAFVLLSDFFNPDDDGTYTYCSSLFECYVSVIREGLVGSGIALEYVGQPGPNFTVYWLRTFFDLSFFIIVSTVGVNIIIAILLDTFSELRTEKEKVAENDSKYCFICGIANDEFEMRANGFQHHIKNDHNKWNYIYFALYLRSMLPNDHNALEKYVYDNINREDIRFFPLREAKVLKKQPMYNSVDYA